MAGDSRAMGKRTAASVRPKMVSDRLVLSMPGLEVRSQKWDYGAGVRDRQVVRLQDSVVILPITAEGKIVLIKHFRIPTRDGEHWLYELPAGKIDMLKSGRWERPKCAAARELSEELGYTAKRLEPLTPGYTTPGKVTEKQFPFIATGLKKGRQHLELGEVFAEIIEVTPAKALRMVDSGVIQDYKTQNLIRAYALRVLKASAPSR